MAEQPDRLRRRRPREIPAAVRRELERATRRGRKGSGTARAERLFKRAIGLLAEHHDDYLVIAQSRDGNSMLWRSSGRTYGVGAATRYLTLVDEDDRIMRAIRAAGD